MRYKEFGKSGMKLSEMCLGTWGMGGVGWSDYSTAERVDAIAAAIECGVNFIDTAPAYNGGAAERLLGQALKDLGARDKVYISTKCGSIFTDGITYIKDSSPEMLRKQCEDSLRNLPLSHIALNWSIAQDIVSSCIVGAQTRAKVEENCAAFDVTLNVEEMNKLNAAIAQYQALL